ncbi:glucose PTS transporter transcription antiterminator GlcT [Brevibacillus sp. SYSU BS000544]|uniref:glucose PTS transporter transcription antiterminator GlcT n=1 Tax=Brevibacillus sp. SYSU BS000544 TaxID=3416443 RepID=UPI003CE57E67
MTAGNRYTIERAFNNNVVLVKESLTDAEIILLGKGIGFSKKPGDQLETSDTRIEKKFRLEDQNHIKQYRSLLNQVDESVIGLSEEIIAIVAKELNSPLNEHVHVALPDHIQFAIHRLRNGLEIVNPFLFEIQTLYPKEFALAKRASQMIEERFAIQIPESETGFLTLHIHSAANASPVSSTVRFTNLIKELVEQVENQMSVRLEKDSVEYARLITHLRFAIERIRQGKVVVNPLLDRIKQMCGDSYTLAESLSQLITERLEIAVPEDEVGYIAMHLYRLTEVKDDN